MKNKSATKTRFIADHISDEIKKLKEKPGKNILIFGSPGTSHVLMEHNLIDEFWLFVNPVILGNGIPLFAGITNKIDLKLLETKEFPYGVIALHYHRKE
jgi:dihydrofolate reductase